MSGERGPISIEEVSRSMVLADSIRSSSLIGEKSGSQADVAEQKAQELLKSRFLPSSYESVTQIKEVIDNPSSSEIQKVNAKKTLADLGSALIIADPKLLDKIGQIDANVPPSFRGISEEVSKNWFVNGPDDEIGKSLVTVLGEIESFNLKVKRAPNVYEPKRGKVVEDQMEVVMGMFDTVEESSLDGLKIGAVVGYLDGMVKKVQQPVKERDKTRQAENENRYFRPKINPETGEYQGTESAWVISKENFAAALKYMADDLRWSDWTPPEWYKYLPLEEQNRISLAAMVNEGASWVNKIGPDLEKIKANPLYKSFDSEKFTSLFNDEFKLVMSKMFHDLCETYADQNGNTCMRYKEVFYKKHPDGSWVLGKDNRREVGVWGRDNGAFDIDQDVSDRLINIRDFKDSLAEFLSEQNGKWLRYSEGEPVPEGLKVVDGFVCRVVKDQKTGEETFKKIPDYMSQINAYTAWNLFFMFGDSSLADRMRVLPTFGGIINDGIRTLNLEKKAFGKWNVEKGGVESSDTMFGSEWFGGNIGTYVQKVMGLEQSLGRDEVSYFINSKGERERLVKRVSEPIDGDLTLREKIISGKNKIFQYKTSYGFFDFVNGSRDLRDASDQSKKLKDETLGTLLWNYGDYVGGKFSRKEGTTDFVFKKGQVDFLNWYRDQQEAAALTFNVLTGKEDIKDINKFVSRIRSAYGMVDGLSINDTRISYVHRPDFWANLLAGSFEIDLNRLSSDYIRLQTAKLKDTSGKEFEQPYDVFVFNFLTETLKLTNEDTNLSEVMRLLGVDLKEGEDPRKNSVTRRTDNLTIMLLKRTKKLMREQNDAYDYSGYGILNRDKGEGSDYQKMRSLEREFSLFNGQFVSYDAQRVYKDLSYAIRARNLRVSENLWRIFCKEQGL